MGVKAIAISDTKKNRKKSPPWGGGKKKRRRSKSQPKSGAAAKTLKPATKFGSSRILTEHAFKGGRKKSSLPRAHGETPEKKKCCTAGCRTTQGKEKDGDLRTSLRGNNQKWPGYGPLGGKTIPYGMREKRRGRGERRDSTDRRHLICNSLLRQKKKPFCLGPHRGKRKRKKGGWHQRVGVGTTTTKGICCRNTAAERGGGPASKERRECWSPPPP